VLSSFPPELTVSTDCRPLSSCPDRFILPYASLPFRVLPFRTRPAPPGVEPLPWGWPCPLRDVSLQRPCNGVPIPPPCRPRRFSRPRRFAPLPALWVYFTPQPRPGFPFRGFPSRTAVAPRRRPVALSSVDDGSLLAVAHQRHVPSPRPQGFAPCGNPLPNLRCLAADPTRSPPGLSLLQVLPLDAVRTPSRPLPLMTFTGALSSHLPG
jgi:hypothetical protein